ncbi:MAG: PLP-dependent aminotransferase family protein [Clostridiales bacterium]|jgi:GntR family transcriptional regulator/MocR family aminotransferase|nr:PLP-dependent aminotransferase family protein [Clostridiales bacterium]
MNNFTINLEREDRKIPLYEQIYLFICNEIKSGRLKADEKLPSKRSLAAHLMISLNTVETAYSMLLQEGYIYSAPRSGYYVSRAFVEFSLPEKEPPIEPPASETRTSETRFKYGFLTNTVDTSSFPFKTWAKLGKEVLYSGQSLLSIGDPSGDVTLRESLCKYLREFRAVDCSPSQIVIGAGIEYLLMLLNRIIPHELTFAVEDPGYGKTRAVLLGGRRKLSYIPLDHEGMSPSCLSASGADIAYITPSCQFPTGIIMPVARRLELISWANEYEYRYIIEDDYNSEFNLMGKPIPSLQGMDSDKVIYMSTFSRSLAPSIRIAYMVLPKVLLKDTRDMLSSYSSTVSRFEQNTLARFIDGGYLNRHINRMKTLYRRRKEFFLEYLKPYLEALDITVSGDTAGLHLLLTMPKALAEEVYRRAEANKIKLYRLSEFYAEESDRGRNTLLLGFAGTEKEDLKNAVDLLFGNLQSGPI